jgi:hypothetical protein
MMDAEKTILDLCYVGTVYVDVGYNMDIPTAETFDGWLGAVDLGGTISVNLLRYMSDDPDELSEDDPPSGSVGMWKKLIIEMRDMLARCFVFGEMKIGGGGWLSRQLDKEEEKNIDQAFRELADDDLTIKITPALAVETLQVRARHEQAVTDGIESLVEFIRAQQDHPDENINLGEAMQRQQEGTEILERMLEDDEEADE